MGRGRQKAKQTKVARRLKYYTPETDIRALERELTHAPEPEEDDDDPYAHYYPAADIDDWGPPNPR